MSRQNAAIARGELVSRFASCPSPRPGSGACPIRHVGERRLHSKVRFHQLRNLLQTIAESAYSDNHPRRRLILRRIRRLQHLHRLKRLIARRVQNPIARALGIHRLKRIRAGEGVAAPSRPP
jgi:hypothetical protein